MRNASLLPRNSTDALTLLTRLLLAAFVAGASFLAALLFFLLAMRVVFIGCACPACAPGEVGLSGKIGRADRRRRRRGLHLSADRAAGAATAPRFDGASGRAGREHRRRGGGRSALAVGRRGFAWLRLQEQIDAWLPAPTSPRGSFSIRRARAYLQTLAATIDKPQFEATLGINGLEVTCSPARSGGGWTSMPR
jgi:hypothetical protein